jgi:hypothetical protein
VLQPALELGAQVGQASEVLAVEGRLVELLERGPLETLADRVVVGRAGRDAMLADAEVLKVAGERFAGELGAVVGQLDPDAGQPLGDVVDEAGGVTGGLVAGDQPPDRIAGGGVDRRELPDRPDALELPT